MKMLVIVVVDVDVGGEYIDVHNYGNDYYSYVDVNANDDVDVDVADDYYYYYVCVDDREGREPRPLIQAFPRRDLLVFRFLSK